MKTIPPIIPAPAPAPAPAPRWTVVPAKTAGYTIRRGPESWGSIYGTKVEADTVCELLNNIVLECAWCGLRVTGGNPGAEVSHTICSNCLGTHFPEIADDLAARHCALTPIHQEATA